MAYLQKKVDTSGVSEEELARRWDNLSLEDREKVFRGAASEDDLDEWDEVSDMELGYLSERCSHRTVQGVVDHLALHAK